MNYKEAFDKLTIAYIGGQVNGFDNHFCFCGNLENNTDYWKDKILSDRYFRRGELHNKFEASGSLAINYTATEYEHLELAYMEPLKDFFSKMPKNYNLHEYGVGGWIHDYNIKGDYNAEYEEANHKGFVDALEVLKQIHISRGEDVDEGLKLIKKQPVLA